VVQHLEVDYGLLPSKFRKSMNRTLKLLLGKL
jgi:hypothetical protein